MSKDKGTQRWIRAKAASGSSLRNTGSSENLNRWLERTQDISLPKGPAQALCADMVRKVRRQAASHFRFFLKEKQQCEQITADLALATRQMEVCVQTSGHADPTYMAVVQLEEKYKRLFLWQKVVQLTMKAFQHTQIGDLLHMRYVLQRSPEAVQSDLFLSKSAYYDHLNCALTHAALLASVMGLLTLD